MPTAISSAFPDLIANGAIYDAAFLRGYEMAASVYKEIARVYEPGSTPQKDRVRMTSLTAAGAPELVAELGEIPSSSPTAGYSKEIAFTKYAQRLPISYEAIADDQTGLLLQAVTRYGDQFRLTHEKQVARVYKDAFTGTYFTGGDGLALCHDSHPITKGSATTSDNKITAVLSADNLDAALKAFMELKGSVGEPLGTYPNKLLVPPALASLAHRLVDSQLRQGTANNDTNWISRLGIKVVVNPWIGAAWGGSDTAWFLINDLYLDVSLYFRTAVEVAAFDDVKLQEKGFAFSQRLGVGFNDWRGVLGSTGAG